MFGILAYMLSPSASTLSCIILSKSPVYSGATILGHSPPSSTLPHLVLHIFPPLFPLHTKEIEQKEKEKEKKRKHFISLLHPCLLSTSPMPVSLSLLITVPSILFPYHTPLLYASSIPPLFSPTYSSRNAKETENIYEE
jgi:hypothetical protein